MKKIFITLVFFQLIFINDSYSQISYEEILIINLSDDYVFLGEAYYSRDMSPNYSILSNTLASMQARFDRGYNNVRYEWLKLKDLNMINNQTNAAVTNYRNQVSAWFDVNGAKVDWGYGDNASRVIKFITGVYDLLGVKQELKLMKSIDKEIKRLKSVDPDGFHNSNRYKDMLNVIYEMRSCNVNEFGNIAYRYGLF